MTKDYCDSGDSRASYALFQENFEELPSLEEERTSENDEPDVVEEDEKNTVLYTESELDSIVSEKVREAVEKERNENNYKNKDILDKELGSKFKAIENSIHELNEKIEKNIKTYSEKLYICIFNMFDSVFPSLKGDRFNGFDIYSVIFEEISKSSNVSVKMNGETFKNIKKNKENECDDHIDFEIDEKMNDTDFEISWNNGNVNRNVGDIVKKILSNFNLTVPATLNGEIENV